MEIVGSTLGAWILGTMTVLGVLGLARILVISYDKDDWTTFFTVFFVAVLYMATTASYLTGANF